MLGGKINKNWIRQSPLSKERCRREFAQDRNIIPFNELIYFDVSIQEPL
jgi:hypothetical protein